MEWFSDRARADILALHIFGSLSLGKQMKMNFN